MLQTLVTVLIVACSALYVVWALLLPGSVRRSAAQRLLLRQHRGCSHQPQGGTEGRQAPGVGLPPCTTGSGGCHAFSFGLWP